MTNILLSILLVSIFIVLNIGNQTTQGLILFGLSFLVIYGIALKGIYYKKYLYSFYLLLLIILFSLFFYKVDSYFYFISELKILPLFFLALLIKDILKKGNHNNIFLNFYKIVTIIILTIGLYGLVVKGLFRYTGFLAHSIYLSIVLNLMYSYFYKEVKIAWRIITFVTVFLLGSSNGVIIFLILTLKHLKWKIYTKICLVFPAMYFSYWFIAIFRDRPFLGEEFFQIDRVRIFSSVVYNAFHEFSFVNYMFGWGIGRELNNFKMLFHSFSADSIGFQKYFSEFTSNGVFSYSFHNEILRIFFDFGILGLITISILLYKKLGIELSFILLFAAMTNTILFSTIGLFVISILMAVRDLNNDKYVLKQNQSIDLHKLVRNIKHQKIV